MAGFLAGGVESAAGLVAHRQQFLPVVGIGLHALYGLGQQLPGLCHRRLLIAKLFPGLIDLGIDPLATGDDLFDLRPVGRQARTQLGVLAGAGLQFPLSRLALLFKPRQRRLALCQARLQLCLAVFPLGHAGAQ